MPSGDTFVTTVEEGLDTVIASARIVREYPHNIMPKLVDKATLPEGTGTSWREFAADQITAQNYGETDTIDNPQELDGSVLSGTPQLSAVHTFVGRRVAGRLNSKAYAQLGGLAQNAINRLMDTDGLAMFATATTTLAGTATSLTSGHIRAGVERIASDANEPGDPPYYVVLHGYGLYDLSSEVLGGVGTYNIPEGFTRETYMHGFTGMVEGAEVWRDGLITVNATPDARGGVFAKKGLVLIQGFAPWKETREEPQKGYGGMSVWLKDEYLYIERSPGNWMYGLLHDATAPTS